ncbi:MAG: hypothetical protein ACFE0O_12400 [Opitutales bacterium]
MRTTVDLPDPLFRQAKRLAAERGTTVRSLIIEALRMSLDERQAPDFQLRDASFGDQNQSVSADTINTAIDESRESGFPR